METMNIALPTKMKRFVQKEVGVGGYSSASEYIRDLIRREQKRKDNGKLEALLLEGIESGPSKPMTGGDWDALRERLRKRQPRKNPAR
jgi:antitoxin ParD1/3/4